MKCVKNHFVIIDIGIGILFTRPMIFPMAMP